MWRYDGREGEVVVARILGALYNQTLDPDSYVTCEIVWATLRIEQKAGQLIGDHVQLPLRLCKLLDPIWLGQMYNLTVDLIKALKENYETA